MNSLILSLCTALCLVACNSTLNEQENETALSYPVVAPISADPKTKKNKQQKAQLTNEISNNQLLTKELSFSHHQQVWLYVGTRENGDDLFSDFLSDSKLYLPQLDLNGQTIYITLWTQIDGQWAHNKYQLQTGTH